MSIRGDLDVGDRADRDAADLHRVALDELAGVLELGGHLVGAGAEREIAHHRDRNDDRRDGGEPTYPTYRSHLLLSLSPWISAESTVPITDCKRDDKRGRAVCVGDRWCGVKALLSDQAPIFRSYIDCPRARELAQAQPRVRPDRAPARPATSRSRS